MTSLKPEKFLTGRSKVLSKNIQERKAALTERLQSYTDKDDRLRFIIESGKNLPAMDEKFKIDQFLVKGCISQAWLFPQLGDDGLVIFHADSEAMIVKGIIALLLEVFNGSTPAEILTEDGSFLTNVGVTQHLSTNRRNGLANVLKMIHFYAAAFAKQQA